MARIRIVVTQDRIQDRVKTNFPYKQTLGLLAKEISRVPSQRFSPYFPQKDKGKNK